MRIRNGALNEQVATMVKDQRRSARVGSRTSFSLLYLVAISLLVFGCKTKTEKENNNGLI